LLLLVNRLSSWLHCLRKDSFDLCLTKLSFTSAGEMFLRLDGIVSTVSTMLYGGLYHAGHHPSISTPRLKHIQHIVFEKKGGGFIWVWLPYVSMTSSELKKYTVNERKTQKYMFSAISSNFYPEQFFPSV